MQSTYLIIFIVYMLVVVAVGYYASKKKVGSYDGYLVADRNMPFIVLLMTYAATGMGAGFTTGTVEKGYDIGLAAALYPTAEAFGSFMLAFFFAKYLNKAGRKLKLYTISQYLESVYDVRMRVIAAILNAAASMIIVGGQIIAGASVISIITGISLSLAILIAGAIVLYYTVSGGLWAVAYTDVVQGGLVWLGMVIAVPLTIHAVGGWTNVTETVDASFLSLTSGGAMKFFIVAALASIFNSVTDQTEVQRILAARTPSTAKNALLLRTVVQTPIGWLSAIIAVCCLILYPNEANATMLLPNLISDVFNPIVGGIFLVALMGAVMSTGDTLLSAGSAVLVEDIYHRFVNKDASDKQLLKAARIITFILGVASIIVCFYLPGIVDSIIIAFSLKGGALAFPIIASVFWGRLVTKDGAFWGTVITAIVISVWQFSGVPYSIDPILVGIPISVISCLIISKFTRKGSGTNLSA